LSIAVSNQEQELNDIIDSLQTYDHRPSLPELIGFAAYYFTVSGHVPTIQELQRVSRDMSGSAQVAVDHELLTSGRNDETRLELEEQRTPELVG